VLAEMDKKRERVITGKELDLVAYERDRHVFFNSYLNGVCRLYTAMGYQADDTKKFMDLRTRMLPCIQSLAEAANGLREQEAGTIDIGTMPADNQAGPFANTIWETLGLLAKDPLTSKCLRPDEFAHCFTHATDTPDQDTEFLTKGKTELLLNLRYAPTNEPGFMKIVFGYDEITNNPLTVTVKNEGIVTFSLPGQPAKTDQNPQTADFLSSDTAPERTVELMRNRLLKIYDR